MPLSRRLEILSFVLVASIGLLLWDHRPRPVYVPFMGSGPETRQATIVEILSHAGLGARLTDNGGIEVRKGENEAAFLAHVRDPRYSPGY